MISIQISTIRLESLIIVVIFTFLVIMIEIVRFVIMIFAERTNHVERNSMIRYERRRRDEKLSIIFF